MKIISYIFFFFAVLGTGNTFAQDISGAELQVNGLTCSMCSRATETAIKSLGFIDTIKPDLNRNVFVLTFKPGQAVSLDAIRDKVQEAGFSIGDLSATINFKQTSVDRNGMARLGNHVFRLLNVKDRVLDGPVTARVLDRDFISDRAFKSKAAELKSADYQSGSGQYEGKQTRIIHLSI